MLMNFVFFWRHVTVQVEKIVGHREKGGTTVFRIRWKGWAAKDDTWQEEDDLNCGAILKKYKATLKATASPKKSAAASPKKQGRASLTAAAKKSPKKGVAAGKVTKKKMGRPSATKSPKKKTKKAAEGGKKRGRKPKSETEWEVEEVTAVRTTEAGTEEFYIKWKGYSSEENTWEPAENVANCDKAINRFRESQGEDGAPATTNGDAEEEEEDGGGDEEKEAAAEEEEDEKDVSGVAEDADDASMDE